MSSPDRYEEHGCHFLKCKIEYLHTTSLCGNLQQFLKVLKVLTVQKQIPLSKNTAKTTQFISSGTMEHLNLASSKSPGLQLPGPDAVKTPDPVQVQVIAARVRVESQVHKNRV